MQVHYLQSQTFTKPWADRHFPSKQTLVRKSLRTVTNLLEMLVGLHLGALVGWPMGWWAGSLYAACMEPTHQATFEQVRAWCYLPAVFADYGLCVGAVIGIMMVRYNSRKILEKRIKIQYEKGQTKPSRLAAALYHDENKIELILNRMLADKRVTPETEQQLDQ